jgi:cephalosporin-C deacetylase
MTQQIDEFWESTLARGRAESLDARIEQLAESVPYLTYRVSYRSLGGVRVTALLATPIEGEYGPSAKRRLPAVITAPGYGGREFGQTLSECQRGFVVMQIYPRDQGESARDLPPGRGRHDPPFLYRGISNREGFYYQGAYVDMVRGLDYLRTRDDVDPDRLGAAGTSQGGALVLAAAALDARVRAVVAHVPFLCDMRNNASPHLRDFRDDPEKLAVLDYFDPVNLAHRIRAAALLSTGGKDDTCPTAPIRAVFDRLPGIKAIAHYPELTHTSCGAFYGMTWEWLQRYLAV